MARHTIVWVDCNSTDPNSSFRTKLGDAKLFTKNDIDKCVEYIKSDSNTSIYLIVSGSLSQSLVPEVYNCKNLIKIFLFCGSVAAYANWAIDYCDKLMIFDHGDDLLERLWNDLETVFREQAKQYSKCADEFRQRAQQYKQPACG